MKKKSAHKPKHDLYAELGVDEKASSEQIKKAYREQAKVKHPDKGGTHESMTRLQLAYDTLSDDSKRERYDETGETDEDKRKQEFLWMALNRIALGAAASVNPNTNNLVELMRESIHHTMAGQEMQLVQLGKEAQRLKSASERFVRLGGKVNFIQIHFEANIAANKNQQEAVQQNIDNGHALLKLLEEFEYITDSQSGLIATGQSGSSFAGKGFWNFP